jgi:2-oxoglutarate ferredoxin oxidoreductase subunit alpha
VEEEQFNIQLMAKYREIEKNEIRFRENDLEDADIMVVAFGTSGRIAQSAITMARQEGIKVGLFRPISLYPYPYDRIRELAQGKNAVLVVEMSGGQMIEDVRLAVQDRAPISFYGRMGGIIPLPDEIFEEIKKIHKDITEAAIS